MRAPHPPVLRAPVALALVLAAGVLGTAGPTHASSAHICRSSDLRFPFQKGGPRTFGVFRLRVSGGSCATARHAAKTWMTHIEANIRRGSEAVPRSAAGFRFRTLKATAAQTYREVGRRGRTTISFAYVIPNG